MSVKSANANNSYSGFCDAMHPKRKVSSIKQTFFKNSDSVHGLLGNSAKNFFACSMISGMKTSLYIFILQNPWRNLGYK